MQMPDSLAEKILKASGAVNQERLLDLKTEVKTTHVPLAELILGYNILSEEELALALAKELGLPFVQLSSLSIDPAHLRALPEHMSRRHGVVVFGVAPDKAKQVAVDSQLSPQTQELIAKALGPNYQVHIATSGALHSALDAYRQHSLIRPAKEPSPYIDDTKVLQSIHHILEQAIISGASSIHLEPRVNALVIRFRIDGRLKEAYMLPSRSAKQIRSRIKQMAGLHGLGPSEGQFKVEAQNHVYRVEVLTLPAVDGEKITLKLFNENAVPPELRETGLWGRNLEVVERATIVHRGLIIVSGPRKSGKTTTLYSFLKALNVANLNVLTIENRRTYKVRSTTQLELGPSMPNYEMALSAALKQEPEVLLIDRVFSSDALGGVMSASTTSLVLAGVNSMSALSSLSLLNHLGVEPFRLAHSTHLVVNTRLVRRLCDDCKQAAHPTNEILRSLIKTLGVSSLGGIKALHHLEKQFVRESLGTDKKTDLSSSETSIKRLWQANADGCNKCNFTGYRGLIGLQEVLEINEDIRAKLALNASESELEKIIIKFGFIPLSIDGLIKSLRGLTSIDELLGVL